MAYSPIFGTPQVQPGMLGLNPASRRQQQVQGVGDLLTSLGIGLMGQGPTRTPQSPLSGLGQGLALNGQMQQQRQAQQSNDLRDQLAQGQYGMEADKYNTDKQYAQARQDAMEKAIANLPIDQQTAARADPETFWKAYADHMFQKPTDKTPKLQTMRRGTTDETGYFDESGKWVKMSEGAAFAPQRDNPNFGNTPIYVNDPQGNTHLFRFDPNGGAIEAQLPKGWQVAPQAQVFDAGTAGVPVNKRTGTQIPSAPEIPKDLAGAASQTAQGTAQGQAASALPSDIATATTALSQVQELLSETSKAGRETATGLSSYLDPRNYIPGTDAYNFKVRVKQLQGGVFLTAYKTLRGSGAITEIEGQQAKDAIARLDTAQSDEEFVKALNDYSAIIDKGLKVSKQRASATPVPPGGAASDAAPASGTDPLGLFGGPK